MSNRITPSALCGHPALDGVVIQVVRFGTIDKLLMSSNYRSFWSKSKLHKNVKLNLQQLADSCTLAANVYYGDGEFNVIIKVNGKVQETHAYIYGAGERRIKRLLPSLGNLEPILAARVNDIVFWDIIGVSLMYSLNTDTESQIATKGSRELNV